MLESWKVRSRKIGKSEKWKVRPRKIGKMGKLGPEELENWKNGKLGPEKLENWKNGKLGPGKLGGYAPESFICKRQLYERTSAVLKLLRKTTTRAYECSVQASPVGVNVLVQYR